MMKKTKLIRGGIMALFVLAALLLVYLVVRQTMPDIIPLLRSGDEEALEAYLSRDMSFTGILYMRFWQMVQVWSIVISGVIVNVAAGRRLWRLARVRHPASSRPPLRMASALRSTSVWGSTSISSCRTTARTNSTLLRSLSIPAYMVVTLCFLPLIPNGFIPIAASRSRLKPWEFTLAMFFGSAFSTLVYCWLGSNLIHGDWIGSAVLVVLMLSIAFLLWKYQKQVLHLVGQLLEKRKQRNGNKNADLSESSRV